ncbi:hypothetical protein SCHPADRAFT_936999 [Schizopora paradoxa]|uniref:Uncharacterized protein n=1 Tax=Schizopora paradoxa TaxID=27342 RepID=A0A0H2SK68_9AGAM|nr:hypothetical protein SCHPADRAFT_936999 [Schizopora paradoxa]
MPTPSSPLDDLSQRKRSLFIFPSKEFKNERQFHAHRDREVPNTQWLNRRVCPANFHRFDVDTAFGEAFELMIGFVRGLKKMEMEVKTRNKEILPALPTTRGQRRHRGHAASTVSLQPPPSYLPLNDDKHNCTLALPQLFGLDAHYAVDYAHIDASEALLYPSHWDALKSS